MLPFALRESIVAVALALGVVPAGAGSPVVGASRASAIVTSQVAGAAASDEGEDSAASLPESTSGTLSSGAEDGADADTPAFAISALSLPTQSLTSAGNPATSNADRARHGGTSKLVSAAWSNSRAAWWEPNVSYVMQQDRALVQPAFGAADASGPDSRATLVSHSVASEWSLQQMRIGYRLSNAVEDAAEANVSAALSSSSGRGAYVGWQIAESVDVQFDFGTDRVRDQLSGTASAWRSRAVSASWRLDHGFALGGSLYETRSVAGEAMPALRNRLAELSLSYAIGGSPYARAAGNDAHAYLRMERQSLSGEGIVFSADTPQRPWNVIVGLSMPF